MKKKLLLGIFVIGIVLCFSLIKTQAITTLLILEDQSIESSIISLSPGSPKLLDLSLVPHEPITIINDGNFSDYGFQGTGEEANPYIIEGFNITTNEDYGIYITKTTKYFDISDCYIDASSGGIYIYDVALRTATILNNTCNNNNAYGILVEHSYQAILANNTCNNNDHGIELSFSGSSTVANNTCNSNDYGIYLWDSGSSTVTNNTCNNNNYGIQLWASGNSTVANNTLTNCGLYIRENSINAYLSDTVKNNWVNGKKLGFYTKLDSTIIDEPIYGQLILVNCTNVIVRDQIFNNATTGLFLYSCTYSVMINNTCSNNRNGIELSFSGSSTVANNTCNNNFCGIDLWGFASSTVANNTCNNNLYGIDISSSSNSVFTDNTCSNNMYGIVLSHSVSSSVANNTCNSNFCGIGLSHSVSSSVANNTCNSNLYGIRITYKSSFCLVTYNLLQENEEYGIRLGSTSDNIIIHHNVFVDNNLEGTSQAFDDGANNVWYDTSINEGNYWSNLGMNSTYEIDGSAGSVDFYPFDEKGNPPAVAEFMNRLNVLILIYVLGLAIIPVSITRKRLKDR